MGRIFPLVALLVAPCSIIGCLAQNLVLNPDFEKTTFKVNTSTLMKNDTFYALNWFTPTDGSVDIYRDIKACDNKHFLGGFDECINAKSGNYALGLGLIIDLGWVEHITGTLSKPLIAGKAYKVSYYLKFGSSYASSGFGYKFSNDSVVFKSNNYFMYKQTPSYNTLFETNKIYADFKLNHPFTDTTWRKIESVYTAKGGEQFITFGQFCYPNDTKLIKQFNKLQHKPMLVSANGVLIDKKKSILHQYCAEGESFQDVNYYFLDLVEVSSLTPEEEALSKLTCDGCIDSDPLTTNIPDTRELKVDRGFEGDLSITIQANLKHKEKLVMELDKDKKIIVVNLNNKSSEEYQSVTYSFKYPARKLYKKPLRYYIQQTSDYDMNDIEKTCTKTPFTSKGFKGLLFTNIISK